MNVNFYQFLSLIDYLLYGSLIIVTALILHWLMGADIKIRVAHYRYRMRIKRQQLQKSESSMPKSPWFRHLYQLFAIRTATADAMTVYGFLVVEAFLFVSVFLLVAIRLEDAVLALLFGTITMVIPYLYLTVTARTIRNEVGSKVHEIVQTLIHSYSATRGDMYAALTMTHHSLKEKELKKVLARLISDLQTAHDEETLREVVEFFIFTTGSSWGMRLGNIILKSYVYQENVTTALLTLQQQMITHQKMLEEEKADASDVSLQAGLAIFLFPISLLGANYITNPQNWWVLQFREPVAFGSFVITLLLVLISGLIGYIVRKPRHDL
ncbi:MAG: hypothetical protein R3267_02365 [Paenisporosarcina sp.]|nr:hypothetical protein [Paenisporosarcina sp.]